ncbi:sugar transferase [soil metagenome]
MLALADVAVAIVGALALSDGDPHLAWAVLAVPIWILAAKLLGLYDRDHVAMRHQTLDEIGAVAGWVAFGIVITGLSIWLFSDGVTKAGSGVLIWLVLVPSALALRAATRLLWRLVTPAERTAVLGAGELADSMRRKLTLFPDMNLEVVTIRGEDEATVEQIVQGVDRVVVAVDHPNPDRIEQLVRACRLQGVKLSVVSPLRGRARPSAGLTQVADLPVLGYETWDVSRSTLLIKRGFDLIVGALIFLVFAVLLPVIAAAIKIDSKGPVFFRQLRAGEEGNPFRMIKFRTMVADAETRLGEHVRLEELDEPMFKLTADPRVTRVGRVLRKLSLDELPQVLNVLRGQMSVVGPRPEQMELVERYRPEHMFRLALKPGLTGPMQIFGRGELTFVERLAVELDYVEHVSLSRDLRILAETIPAVLRGRGAY